MPKKKTNDEFIAELKIKAPTIISLAPYQGATTAIPCKCNACNYIWKVKPYNILNNGHGCPNCAGNITHTNQSFVKKLKKVLPEITPLEEYKGSNKLKIRCRCENCGFEWPTRPDTLLKGHGCPKCAFQKQSERQRKGHEAFVEELNAINPYIIVLGKYTTALAPIKVKCSVCEYTWMARPNNLLRGSGCLQCSRSQTSVVEQIIYNAFSMLLGEDSVINRDKSAIGKELDIYLPHLKAAIEFGAWHWHKNRLDKDLQKQELCKQKGITLFFIYEGCPKEASENPYNLNAFFYEQVFSTEKDYETTKNIIRLLSNIFGINSSKVVNTWAQTVQLSIKQAKKQSEADFVKELSEVNANISYVSGYINRGHSVHLVCNICGYKWQAIPSVLLSGHGCPKCSRTKLGQKMLLPQEEIKSRVATLYPDLEVIGPYLGKEKHIDVYCKKCKNKWSVRAGNLMRGVTHCPNCNPKNSSVMCIETGVVYSSMHEANRQTGANRRTIKISCENKERTAGGYHWKYVNDDSKGT